MSEYNGLVGLANDLNDRAADTKRAWTGEKSQESSNEGNSNNGTGSVGDALKEQQSVEADAISMKPHERERE
jgi:hypothetical protein